MDIEDVDRRAARVVEVGDSDPERSHALLDDLWQDVLDAIAHGRLSGDDAERACQLALAPLRADVRRWYA